MSTGPDGMCWGECREVKFGALPSMPPGYSVWWHEEHEHYQGHGPDEWETAITCDRFSARLACIFAAQKLGWRRNGRGLR